MAAVSFNRKILQEKMQAPKETAFQIRLARV
jgi:hypothetical protein